MVQIRSLKKLDLPDVIKIIKEACIFDKTWDSADNLISMVEKDKDAVYVAQVNNKIAGLIQIVPYGQNVSWLFRLIIKKQFRGSGIGSKLLKKAEEILKKKGNKEIGLFVNAENNNLKSFYKKRGFKSSNKKCLYLWKKI